MAAFAIAVVTTPAGVSGAVLLLPVPGQRPGHAQPGGDADEPALQRGGHVPARCTGTGGRARPAGALALAAASPGRCPASSRARSSGSTLLPGPQVVRPRRRGGADPARGLARADPGGPGATPARQARLPRVVIGLIAAVAGCVGGIYGIGGGSILAPILVADGQPPSQVAPAALSSTFLTSLAGVDMTDLVLRIAAFFRDESCGQCVPCRVGTVRQEEALIASPAVKPLGSADARRACSPRSARSMRDASICGLGPDRRGAASAVKKLGLLNGGRRHDQHSPRAGADGRRSPSTAARSRCRKARRCSRPAAQRGHRHADAVLPREPDAGQRVPRLRGRGRRLADLVPACSRKAEPGMKVQTDSERVRLSRRLVLEFLASSVDLSHRARGAGYMERYGGRPERYGPPAPPRRPASATRATAGHHHAADGARPPSPSRSRSTTTSTCATTRRCILCYKCVEACGVDAQNTFAIAVAGRGFDARISTELASPLPDSACVYCGNCIGVCPTGALMFKSEHDMRQAGTWDESRQTRPTPSAPTAAWAARSPCTCRTTGSSR